MDCRHARISYLMLLMLLMTFSFIQNVRSGDLQPSECPAKCAYRCSATSHRKPCMVFCQMCCAKCLCVPPGTSGNKSTCPCYDNWKTQQGGPKCP